jgi:hypothetical protein
VLSGVSTAGKQILADLGQALETPEGGAEAATTERIEGDPSKARRAPRTEVEEKRGA